MRTTVFGCVCALLLVALTTVSGLSAIRQDEQLDKMDLDKAVVYTKRDAAVSKRKSVFGECYTHTLVDLNEPAKSLLWRWTVEGRWRLIVPRTHNATGELAKIPEDFRLTPALRRTLEIAKPELYDIQADPLEERNLADQHPEVVRSLIGKLDAWWSPTTK